MTLRSIGSDEHDVLLNILGESLGQFLDQPGTKNLISSDAFDPDGCFLAREKGSDVGCVAVTSLPRKNWLVIRYLAAKHAMSRIDVVEKLLGRALEYVESRRAEFLRATTPAIQPYVDVYKGFGFKPLRRDFRITWDLRDASHWLSKRVKINEVAEKTAREIEERFVESIRPYWDWRTEEQGGEEAVAHNFRDGLKRGERWLSGHVGEELVGFTGLIPDYYKTGDARFRGTYVLPEYRGKGYGRILMNEVSNWAKTLGQQKMTVYTFSYLDSLAPGALLYIKSGGMIDSEYLQMQRA
ncbi:MAG TPA: GNAT family N-acetyltransferase [Candidatus Dormibacteraeota bacterium]|nr:GNAT family N-acetyltransferase [Candidatus Dormibacteraeota bacterium]